MVGANNRILTVSYGTFSCTLEGFDQPFQTMQKIAEYFRDLAAEDRYFGAEPPTPDAEMLHQIAEREINRRVEARLDKQGLVLRAAEKPRDEPALAPAPQAEMPAPTPMPMTAPVAEAPAAHVAPPAAEPVAEEIVEADSVAMKLQRIRAAVANARAASARQAFYDEDLADTIDAPVSGSAPAFEYDIDMGGPLDEDEVEQVATPPVEAEDPKAEEITDAASAEADAEVEVEAEDQPAAEADTIEVEEVAAEEAETSEEAQPDLTAGRRARAIRRQALRRAAIAEAAREALLLATEPAPAQAEEAPEAEAPRTEPETEATPEAVLEPETVEAELGAEAIEEDADWAALDEAAVEPDAEAVAIDAEMAPEDLSEDLAGDLDLDTIAAAVAEPMDMLAPEEAEVDEASLKPLRARVIKVRRIEPLILDAADHGEPEVFDAGDIEDAEAETLLSPEEEADLMRELAEAEDDAGKMAVAADLEEVALADEAEEGDGFEADDFDADEIDAEAAAQEDEAETEEAIYATLPLPEKEPRARTEPEGTDHEDELTRLMEEAETRGATEETRRRFSAIAHLKAAVAATVADRRSRGDDKAAAPKDETRDYRADLNKAVRPRRPVVTGGVRTERPSVEPKRPAPLVLVSEQRIDRPEAAPTKAEPVQIRPRRIAAVEIQTETTMDEAEATPPLSAEEATSFAEFAESRSTQGLAELLEAAAAYTSQVEGRPHFSPPQIMRKVSSIDEGADFSREDRLRVFGTLLRQGKITKVKRGQYAIAEASRFYAEAKEA